MPPVPLRPLALLFCVLSGSAIAQSPETSSPARESLPEPLTLEAALGLIDENQPQLMAAQAKIMGSEASRLDVESDYGFNASLEARLRYVEPNGAASLQQHDDHALSLNLRKRLLDFGYNSARLAAADADQRGYESLLTNARRQHKLEVISAYFSVIEADLRASWLSEAMQVVFLRSDDERERVNLKESSELDGVRSDAEYQASLARSNASEALQRSARAMLAQSLNRPDELPSTLLRPELPLLQRVVPEDLADLTAEALANNAGLRGYGERLAAASRRLEAARASDGPTLDVQGRLASNSRHLGGNDHLQLGLVLEVPLTTGGKTQALIQASRAELLALQAERGSYELELRRRVLEHWQGVQLGRYERAKAAAELELRSQELERSRTLYDQEVASNLGDSMAQYTRAEYEVAVADHTLALAWLQLDALLGREITLGHAVETSHEK